MSHYILGSSNKNKAPAVFRQSIVKKVLGGSYTEFVRQYIKLATKNKKSAQLRFKRED